MTPEIEAPGTGVQGPVDRTLGHQAHVDDLPNEALGIGNASTGIDTLRLRRLTVVTGTTGNVTGLDIPNRNVLAPGEVHQRSQMSRYESCPIV